MLCYGTNIVQHDVFCHAHRRFLDCDAGLPTRYRFDGKLFHLRRLQAKLKVYTDVLHELIYADDLAKNAKTETKTRGDMDHMSQACDNYDLTINTKINQYLECRTAN